MYFSKKHWHFKNWLHSLYSFIFLKQKRRPLWICSLISYLIYKMNTFKVNIKDQCRSSFLLMTEIRVHMGSFFYLVFIHLDMCLFDVLLLQKQPPWKFLRTFWRSQKNLRRDHSFSTYAKFSEKLTFLAPWYAHVRVRIKG